MLIQTQFPSSPLLPLAWIGPLIGALMRPLGGWLADHHGGGRITFWSFAALALGVLMVWLCLPQADFTGNLSGFLVGFAVLFIASGVGNGSTFRMIPIIFQTQRQRMAEPLPNAQAHAARDGAVEGSAALGFASAIGAYGGFFIPKSFGTAITQTGSPSAALQLFFLFYLSCIFLTWWQYSRRGAAMPC